MPNSELIQEISGIPFNAPWLDGLTAWESKLVDIGFNP